MIKAVVFDIGGTLVKTDEAILDAIQRSLQENDILLENTDPVINAFGKSTYHNLETAVRVSYSGPDIEVKIAGCWKSFQRIFPERVINDFSVFPGVVRTLQGLKRKKIQLCIFTGFSRAEAEFLLSSLRLTPYFEFSITRDDVKKARPDPDALLLAVRRFGVHINECLYVGDTVADIQMAKNAGMMMVCVKTGVQSNDVLLTERPDYVIDAAGDILELLAAKELR